MEPRWIEVRVSTNDALWINGPLKIPLTVMRTHAIDKQGVSMVGIDEIGYQIADKEKTGHTAANKNSLAVENGLRSSNHAAAARPVIVQASHLFRL